MIPLPISMPVTYRPPVISLPHTSAVGSLGHVTCETCVDLITQRNACWAHGDETGARVKAAVLADHSREHHTGSCEHEARADTALTVWKEHDHG